MCFGEKMFWGSDVWGSELDNDNDCQLGEWKGLPVENCVWLLKECVEHQNIAGLPVLMKMSRYNFFWFFKIFKTLLDILRYNFVNSFMNLIKNFKIINFEIEREYRKEMRGLAYTITCSKIFFTKIIFYLTWGVLWTLMSTYLTQKWFFEK